MAWLEETVRIRGEERIVESPQTAGLVESPTSTLPTLAPPLAPYKCQLCKLPGSIYKYRSFYLCTYCWCLAEDTLERARAESWPTK